MAGTEQFRLMKHQEEGVAFLMERRSGLIAFEQGLGKTVVAIEAFRRLRKVGLADTLVVMCPNSLKRTWALEISRFAEELGVCIVEGTARERRRTIAGTRADVVLINYEAARGEITAIRALLGRTHAILVLDESHYVKNRKSLNSIAAHHFAPLTNYRWLLSGTPVTNTPSDIYSQIKLIAGENVLGSIEAFLAQYGDAEKTPERQGELAERVAPYVLRRTKEQCLDLPEKTFVDVFVPLPGWQRRLYDELRQGILREVRGMSRTEFAVFAPTAMTRLIRLSQIASNPGLLFPTESRTPGKVVELDRILDELVTVNRRKVVIWSQYVGTIELLVKRYGNLGVIPLYGAVPGEDRQEMVRRFQEDPGSRVLIGNPAAGGSGFTLTAATYTIYETLSWRYDLYAQSQDRIHRIGQTAPVTYIRLMGEDTIDTVIGEALARKTAMAQGIVGDNTDPVRIAEMTPDEFCTMLLTNALPPFQEKAMNRTLSGRSVGRSRSVR